MLTALLKDLPFVFEEDVTFPPLFCISGKNAGVEMIGTGPEFSTTLFISSVITKRDSFSSMFPFVLIAFEDLLEVST